VQDPGAPSIKLRGRKVAQPWLRALAKEESRRLLGEEKEDLFIWGIRGGVAVLGKTYLGWAGQSFRVSSTKYIQKIKNQLGWVIFACGWR